jgi:membrane protein DedA with SNARE-associated domain
MNSQKPSPGNNKILLKYAGLTMQVMVALSLGVFIGVKIDKWLALRTPILVWVLPLLIITAMMWQIIKDTSKKN